MPRPRQILANQFYLLSRRCTQRLFLLRPDEPTTNAFLYCLAVAAQRFHIEVLLTLAESNHQLCAAAHKRCYGERLVMRS
jgi:putative transposase